MENKIKAFASELRNKFGYYESDALDLQNLLRKAEILAFYKELDEGFSGMTITVDGRAFLSHESVQREIKDKYFILINSNHTIGRQNFTICHELYHIFFDPDFTPHKCYTGSFNKGNITEYYADIFASHFLLPDSGVIRMIPIDEFAMNKVSLFTILKIENYYQVSRSALLRKLKDLKIINEGYAQLFRTSVRKNAEVYGFSTKLYETGNDGLIISDYAAKAKYLFDSNIISISKYAELMQDINLDIFREDLNDAPI